MVWITRPCSRHRLIFHKNSPPLAGNQPIFPISHKCWPTFVQFFSVFWPNLSFSFILPKVSPKCKVKHFVQYSPVVHDERDPYIRSMGCKDPHVSELLLVLGMYLTGVRCYNSRSWLRQPVIYADPVIIIHSNIINGIING